MSPGATPCARVGAWCLIVLLGVLLTACSAFVDPGEARLCRALVAGLNPGATGLRFISMHATRQPAGVQAPATSGVQIVYEIDEPGLGPLQHTIACAFTASREGDAAGRDLQEVMLDDELLGPSRIYFARRFWLETAEGVAADPEPIRGQARAIELSRPVAIALQNILAGLPKTGVIVLLALACGLVHGLAGRANLAFGDIAALGGYAATLGVAMMGGGSFPLAAILIGLTLGIWTAACHAGVAERHVFGPLSARRGHAALIASAALGLVLAEFVRLAQGSGVRGGAPFLDIPLALARAGDFIVTVTPMGLVTTGAAGLLAGASLFVGIRSRFGRAWRAVADDPDAASLLGIDVRALRLATFIIAGILAGLSGALVALATGSPGHGTGLVMGLKGVIAAILGGHGSLGGAAAAGLAIGLGEALWPLLLPIEHSDAGLFTVLVVLLILRPGGFFGLPAHEPRH